MLPFWGLMKLDVSGLVVPDELARPSALDVILRLDSVFGRPARCWVSIIGPDVSGGQLYGDTVRVRLPKRYEVA